MTAHAAQRKRDSLNKIKEIKLRKNKLSEYFSELRYQELCRLKFQLNEINNKKVEYAWFRLKTNFYEGGEKTGKILARQVKEKHNSSR